MPPFQYLPRNIPHFSLNLTTSLTATFRPFSPTLSPPPSHFSNFILPLLYIPLSLHPNQAQMAESVDAMVSNTIGAIRAGSTPALGTE